MSLRFVLSRVCVFLYSLGPRSCDLLVLNRTGYENGLLGLMFTHPGSHRLCLLTVCNVHLGYFLLQCFDFCHWQPECVFPPVPISIATSVLQFRFYFLIGCLKLYAGSKGNNRTPQSEYFDHTGPVSMHCINMQ